MTDSIVKSGLGGTASMGIQITCFYWMKTITTYQYRHGMGSFDAIKKLYKIGGYSRFYSGFLPSLVLGCSNKYGDIISYKYFQSKNDLSLVEKTLSGSITAAFWRINMMPLDNLDYMLQTNGKEAYKIMKNKIKNNGFKVLYFGSSASLVNNVIGYFGWFYTFSYLEKDNDLKKMYPNFYNAGQGLISSIVSDTITNPIRVLKIYRQTYPIKILYSDAFKQIIDQYGIFNFITRGLSTRLMMQGIQSSLFVILWKKIDNHFDIK